MVRASLHTVGRIVATAATATVLLFSPLQLASSHKVWGEDYDQLGNRILDAGGSTCSFPIDFTGKQVGGLSAYNDAKDAQACEAACCSKSASDCEVFQWYPSQQPGCWLGMIGSVIGTNPGIVSGARKAPPAPGGPYAVDDTPGMGLRWEGVGAISGGGATSKLLMDYDSEVVSDILDFLFKPNFGLDLDILKVEMGGDTDSTEGAEPSHMHSGPDDANYRRGYEWWLMKEAKARKPALQLYGLPWGFPGWLDPTATASHQAKNPFANANTTANYTLAFLENAKTVHNLTIDYMGQWNERDAPQAYNDALRRVVAESKIVGEQTTVLNRLPHYPGTGTANADCTKEVWNSTDGRYWVDEEGSIFDGRSARCLARCINRQYVTGCHTSVRRSSLCKFAALGPLSPSSLPPFLPLLPLPRARRSRLTKSSISFCPRRSNGTSSPRFTTTCRGRGAEWQWQISRGAATTRSPRLHGQSLTRRSFPSLDGVTPSMTMESPCLARVAAWSRESRPTTRTSPSFSKR